MHWRSFLAILMVLAVVLEVTDPSSNFIRVGWEKTSQQSHAHNQADNNSLHFDKAHTHYAPAATSFIFEVVVPEKKDYICFDLPLHDQFSPPVIPPPNIA